MSDDNVRSVHLSRLGHAHFRATNAQGVSIETSSDGFRILVRDSPPTSSSGGFASLISDVASQVEYILAGQFTARGFDPRTAPLYAQMLVGMVALTGQFWLDHRTINKEEVAAHLVNLAWNGLSGLETRPALGTAATTRPATTRPAATPSHTEAEDSRDEG